mgnify:CR=1 FL=1
MEERKNALTKSDCLDLIREKAAELEKNREHRLPKRSDFSDLEVMMIKSYFGPFPRALEAAGVKQKRQGIEQKRLEKRIRAKRNKLKYKSEKKLSKRLKSRMKNKPDNNQKQPPDSKPKSKYKKSKRFKRPNAVNI